MGPGFANIIIKPSNQPFFEGKETLEMGRGFRPQAAHPVKNNSSIPPPRPIKRYVVNNYRSVTVHLPWRVNLEKIMHAPWDFDVSSVHWTSIKIGAQVHYFVLILERKVNMQLLIKFIHEVKELLVFFVWWIRHLRKFSNITNKIKLPVKLMNQSYTHVNAPYTFAHTRERGSECNCTKIMHACYFHVFWESWIHIGCSMRILYVESMNMKLRQQPKLFMLSLFCFCFFPSRFFLQELLKAMEAGCRTRNPPSILTDATTQRISMQKFAAKECHSEVKIKHETGYSLFKFIV